MPLAPQAWPALCELPEWLGKSDSRMRQMASTDARSPKAKNLSVHDLKAFPAAQGVSGVRIVVSRRFSSNATPVAYGYKCGMSSRPAALRHTNGSVTLRLCKSSLFLRGLVRSCNLAIWCYIPAQYEKSGRVDFVNGFYRRSGDFCIAYARVGRGICASRRCGSGLRPIHIRSISFV